jgi:hypothetical protein
LLTLRQRRRVRILSPLHRGGERCVIVQDLRQKRMPSATAAEDAALATAPDG